MSRTYNRDMVSRSRRSFLERTFEASALSVAAPFVAALRAQAPADPRGAGLLGPLGATRDGATGETLLEVAPGFRYLTFGWMGDPMEGGGKTPTAHDGMAAFPTASKSRIRLVRNHEIRPAGAAFGGGVYDPMGAGGTTTLEFDTAAERLLWTRPSLSGTSTNCAGGPTPWGSWLSCEEVIDGPDSPASPSPSGFTRPHGYVFEVPAEGPSSAIPLRELGRFVHEAVAIDPKGGALYLTEDAARAGLYRFTPRTKGDLARGGRLQMLGIDGTPRADLRDTPTGGPLWKVRWYDISDPDRAHANASDLDREGVFRQGYDQGAAVFRRLEGAWFGNGRIYVTATSGGRAKLGQVWELEIATETLRLVYESRSGALMQAPDNLCVSPKGGLVICEDGAKPNAVRGLTPDGRVFTLARNVAVLTGARNGIDGDWSASEFAGATFSPDGKWLFFNMQRPGITIAMTGPWDDVGL
jgi:hypothetical protein